MSLNEGREYIYSTKNRLKSQLQSKGVDVTDATPFNQYPDKLGTDLSNKSWQYPTSWYQLTPKSEFKNNCIEMVVFDASYEFKMYISGSGGLTFAIYGSSEGGTYKFNGNTYNLNQEYTGEFTSGYVTLQLNRGTGIVSDFPGLTTLKVVFSYKNTLYSWYPYHIDTSHITKLPILAFRAKTDYQSASIYFGRADTSTSGMIYYYRGITPYMQYCDLSMLNPRYSIKEYHFSECSQLVKVELPGNTSLNNFAFNSCNSLVEVIGANFTDILEYKGVFKNCYSFSPPAFNYVGVESYKDCSLIGLDISLKDFYCTYPAKFIQTNSFINSLVFSHKWDKSSIIGDIYRINIPDVVFSMSNVALNGLSNRAIVRLPSNSVTIEEDSKVYTYPLAQDAFLSFPYLIENGENFYCENEVGIAIGPYYGSDEVNLPNVPLRFFMANNANPSGVLKRINFDWSRTTFSTISETTTSAVIDISYNRFDVDALRELFANLPPVSVTRYIKILRNPGASELTDEDIAVATDKGYVVTK